MGGIQNPRRGQYISTRLHSVKFRKTICFRKSRNFLFLTHRFKKKKPQ